ncbi:hypothetical protein C1021_03395 [Neisseria gonorrhoeae]
MPSESSQSIFSLCFAYPWLFSVSFPLRRDVGRLRGGFRLTLSVCRCFCGLKPVLLSGCLKSCAGCFFR